MNIPSISAALLVAAFLAGAGAAVSTVPPEPPDSVPPRRAADAFPPLPVGGLPSNVSVTTIGEGGGPSHVLVGGPVIFAGDGTGYITSKGNHDAPNSRRLDDDDDRRGR